MLRSEIDVLVKNKLKELLCNPNAYINDTDHPVHDLRICGDDISFIFIEDLQEELSVYGTQDDWMAVNTVGDAVDLLHRLKITGQTERPDEPSLWDVLKNKFRVPK